MSLNISDNFISFALSIATKAKSSTLLNIISFCFMSSSSVLAINFVFTSSATNPTFWTVVGYIADLRQIEVVFIVEYIVSFIKSSNFVSIIFITTRLTNLSPFIKS